MDMNINEWQNLRISNDFIFCKVMQNEMLCKTLLETLLKIKISKIDYLDNQKNIRITKDAKSIRLDVYVMDSDKIFNIEMQTTNKKNLELRSRYYQGVIDIDTLGEGKYYEELRETYIIFICTFDPIGLGFSRYTVHPRLDEKNDHLFNDKTHRLFFNTKAYDKELDEKTRAFLRYIEDNTVEGDFVKEVDKSVVSVKTNENWRMDYMTLRMREIEKLQEGRLEGIEIGTQKGIVNAIAMLKGFSVSDGDIVKSLMQQYSLSREQAENYIEKYKTSG